MKGLQKGDIAVNLQIFVKLLRLANTFKKFLIMTFCFRNDMTELL